MIGLNRDIKGRNMTDFTLGFPNYAIYIKAGFMQISQTMHSGMEDNNAFKNLSK
jgi:hypothetical protein